MSKEILDEETMTGLYDEASKIANISLQAKLNIPVSY
jgi:hypothetical protein